MPKPKKSASPKKSRTPAEQKAIDERMAKMRAGRKSSKATAPSPTLSTKRAEPAAAAGPGNTVQTAAKETPTPPKILEWRVEKLSDFASIPLVHLQKALHFFDRAVRKATMENQAVETFTYTEQGAVLVKTVAVDPLA